MTEAIAHLIDGNSVLPYCVHVYLYFVFVFV